MTDTAAEVPGRPHSVLFALLVALIVPGAGQAYNGQPVKGALLLLTSFLALPWFYSLLDAWLRARRIRAEGGRYGKGGVVWVFLQTWLFANVVVAVLVGLTIAGVLV